MGRVTDTKVRGFMVTETNNDACAQLQPVLAHAASLTLHFRSGFLTPGLHTLGSWSISIDSIKLE